MDLLLLFIEFFKIGLFTFGGGYAMIPFITQTVEAHNWMSIEELINFIAISESTPGTFAINISTYVGLKVGGFLGAVIASLSVVLPCFIIILIIARIYIKFKESTVVKGLLFGLTATVVGLIAATVLEVGQAIFFPNGLSADVFSTPAFYVSLFIFLLCTFLLMIKKINPIIIIGISAGLGVVAGYLGFVPI